MIDEIGKEKDTIEKGVTPHVWGYRSCLMERNRNQGEKGLVKDHVQ